MRTLVAILPNGTHLPVRWALFETPLATPVREGVAEANSPLTLDVPVDRCWVLVPGADVTTHLIELPSEASERQIALAASFALEERLAVDPAELHFALGVSETGKRLVGVVSHEAMAAWTARLAGLGIRPDVVVPNYLAIGKRALLHDGYVLAASPEGGFSAEEALAAHILEERTVEVSTEDLLRDAYAALSSGARVNLLQGRYAPRRDWGPILRPWRRAAILAASVALVIVAGFAVDGFRLNQKAEAANARAEAIFRAALPEVKRIVNPRVQMRTYLQGTSLDGGFLALSEILVAGTAAVADAEITMLRFDGRRREIAATFSLPSFEAVERLKNEMAARRGAVHEGGARQDGARILADMTVRQQ